MTHKFHSLCLFLFLLHLIAFSRTSARLLATKQGAEEQDHQILKGVSQAKLDDNESTDKLMGLEICENGDEECQSRRLLSEAHLDYIYTQHQKP